MNPVSVINLASVGVFGLILSAGFCHIRWSRKKILTMAVCMSMILLFQGIVSFFADVYLVKYFYPLITHLPLTIVLWILSREFLWPLISVLTAYLCCQIRRWLALCVVSAFSGGVLMQDTVELIITLPLLFILLRFAAPSVRSVSHSTAAEKYLFGLVPLLYYCYDYLTTFYMGPLAEGNQAAAEFMPFVCCTAFLIFVLLFSKNKDIRTSLEQTQEILNLQVAQAIREIAVLRESHQKTSAYRHDLRHHMQYLLSCIKNERYEQAQDYIKKICWEIEAAKVIVFCENEAANLIFSAFFTRAKKLGIEIQIHGVIPRDIPVSESDWCVLLSNALENALHACQKLKKNGLPGLIHVSAYERKGKIFLEVINSCVENITFSHGIPVTDNPGHGVGVGSICTIVERYGGIYSFSVKNGLFLLRISL